MTHCHTPLQYPRLSGTNVALNSQVCTSTILLLLTAQNYCDMSGWPTVAQHS